MPDKKGRLSPQESRFVEAMARTNDVRISATLAGYSRVDQGQQALARPEIVARIQHEVGTYLRTEGVALGVRVLAEIAEGKEFPAPARAMAARELVKLGGAAVHQDDDSRPLHMLSAAELEARARKAQAWLDELDRNTIEHEPAPSGGFFD